MKIDYIKLLLLLFVISLTTSCDREDPLSTEQYKKEIYINGAYNRVLTFDLPYGEAQDAYISILASGSQRVDKDVNVKIEFNDELVTWYNDKYMFGAPILYQQLNPEVIDMPSLNTTLKGGELYTHLPFKINSSDLHCDSLYSIGFSIASVSEYKIREEGDELIFTLKLINDFSGDYNLEGTKAELFEEQDDQGETIWVESAAALPINVSRIFTATSDKKVRFVHDRNKQSLSDFSSSWEPRKDYFETIDNFAIQFVQIDDSNTFTVEAWDKMEIMDGEAIFDAEEEIFTFWYDYMEGVVRHRMKGIFRK